MADCIFQSARNDFASPYRLWHSVYYTAGEYPHDEKLQCLYNYLYKMFLAEHERRFDDLKKMGVIDYIYFDDDTDDRLKLDALDMIEEDVKTILGGE